MVLKNNSWKNGQTFDILSGIVYQYSNILYEKSGACLCFEDDSFKKNIYSNQQVGE